MGEATFQDDTILFHDITPMIYERGSAVREGIRDTLGVDFFIREAS